MCVLGAWGAWCVAGAGRMASAVGDYSSAPIVRPHRVPVDHATCKVNVRALYTRVDDVHAHALARQIAVVIAAVDRAACAGARDEGKRPGRTIGAPSQAIHRLFRRAVACGGSCARGQSHSCAVMVLLAPAPDSRLAVSVNAVDAPRRVCLHAQPAGHLVQVRRGVAALGQRRVYLAVAVKLNRGDSRVIGHAHGDLVRCMHVGPCEHIGAAQRKGPDGRLGRVLGVPHTSSLASIATASWVCMK